MSKFFNIRQYSCLFMMIMIALTLLLSACPGGGDDDSGTSGGTPSTPTTCPVDGTCISVFEATSELNKASLTVINKSETNLEETLNIRVHIVPEGTNTVAESDDYPIVQGGATIDGNTPPIFSAGLGLSWTLADTALASDASETAIIEVTETLAPGKRLLACIYENSSIGATDIPPIICKKLDSVDLVMSGAADSNTFITPGLDPVRSSGLVPSISGGVFSINTRLKNGGTLDYVPPTTVTEITGIDVYHNYGAAHTTYPTEARRRYGLLLNKLDTDHLTSNIASGATHDTSNIAFDDPYYIDGAGSRNVYACVERVAKEFYIHNNCHYATIDLTIE